MKTGRGSLGRLGPVLSLVGLLGSASLGAQAAAPGHRIFGATTDNQTLMVDSNGVVDQYWSSAFDESLATYLDHDGALLRVIVTDPLPVGGTAGGFERVALDGTVLWTFRYDDLGNLGHHDVAELPNGNVLMVAWEEKTPAEAVAAGRRPSLLDGTFRPDHVIEVEQTGPTSGEIVWQWHAWDHLIQDVDPAADNFGVVGDHPELVDVNYPEKIPSEGDWLHINGIAYDPVYDRILLSPTKVGEIWVIDHSTTTEEAAGHTGGRWGRGGDILYRWGNPQAYRAGTEDDRVFHTQHSPRVIPTGYPGDGQYLVFLNNAPNQTERSAVYQIAPPLDEDGAFVLDPSGVYGPAGPEWEYSADGFYSRTLSSVERLPNGNTLICSGAQGRVFEIDSQGEVVWQFEDPSVRYFNAHYVERWLWSDLKGLSLAAGGSVTLDLIAGTAYAGMDYRVLATRSGTDPGIEIDDLVLPLNPDEVTRLAWLYPNSPTFENSAGTLDSLGRAQAVFNLPPDAWFVPGDVVHFAYLLTDPRSGEAVFASNPAPISIVE